MKRREFIKLTGIATASAPFFTSTRLFAAHDGYTGPLYLMIDANGGWDTTSFCDPKGYTAGQTTPRINNYPSESIGQIGNLRYAPPPDSFIGNTNLYSTQKFFEKYFQKLLIINGINTGTNSHTDGRRVSWSGELGKIGYPNIGAVIASSLASGRSLPFLINGGYNETADLVSGIRLENRNINSLYEIGYPNRVNPDSNTSEQYFSANIENLIKSAGTARSQALLNNQRLPRIRESINDLINSRQDSGHIKNMIDNLASTTEKPLSFFNGRKKAQELYRQGRIALSGYQTGVTAAAHLSLSGFDTHDNHDSKHYPRLMDFLQAIDSILDEAADRGLSDRIVLIIGSDFGRTNEYNVDLGKDHWPITSMMFIGNSQQIITGNRVIGATTSRQKPIKIDRNTFVPDTNNTNTNSIELAPAHIHRALRKLAGVEQNSASLEFSLGGESLNLFS